jgi:hypothetical protein
MRNSPCPADLLIGDCRLDIDAKSIRATERKLLLINNAPEPKSLSANCDDDLVEMPFTTEFTAACLWMLLAGDRPNFSVYRRTL